jgi:hypothetical protein
MTLRRRVLVGSGLLLAGVFRWCRAGYHLQSISHVLHRPAADGRPDDP